MLDLEEINSLSKPKDPGLSQLQTQIKNTMIPLLIKVFQLKLAVQQSTSPPSRLQSSAARPPIEDLKENLTRLYDDLSLLQTWNQSCQKQIEKVLAEANASATGAKSHAVKKGVAENPSVLKSFQGALLSKGPPLNKSASGLSLWKKLTQHTSDIFRKLSTWRQM